MDATAWLVISIVGYSLAGILFIISVFMFFKMNIMAIIGDLTGKTAEKQIQLMREQNAKTGNKLHKPSVFNVERGSLTEKVNASLESRNNAHYLTKEELSSASIKGLTKEITNPKEMKDLVNRQNHLSSNSYESTELLTDDDSTVVLSNETEILYDATEVLMDATELLDSGTEVLSEEDGTTVLSQEDGTTVLYPTEELNDDEDTQAQKITFNIIKDIKITHSNERI